MAKIELKNKLNHLAPNILLIPGGPGLGSDSFEAFSSCFKNINVYFFHPTGTTCEDSTEISSYNDQLLELSKEIKKLGTVYLCGHSFGGIQAVDIALRLPALIKGVICLASPFSENAFKELSINFNREKTSEQVMMSEIFEKNPTNENYQKWFATYSNIYFSKSKIEAGRKLLLEGRVNVKNYLGATNEASRKAHLLNEIQTSRVKKLFIAGNEDHLLPPHILKSDSDSGSFVFKTIDNAGHFVHFEEPEKTAKIVEDFILNEGEIA
ncbi:MAG: alpha/beta hydrolase [Bacteriovoracaceae bacterium]|nr:alpha/beta hydrolase [Bacteriovoracaceae bacterium]